MLVTDCGLRICLSAFSILSFSLCEFDSESAESTKPKGKQAAEQLKNRGREEMQQNEEFRDAPDQLRVPKVEPATKTVRRRRSRTASALKSSQAVINASTEAAQRHKFALFSILSVFILSAGILMLILLSQAPPGLFIPRSISDAKAVAKILSAYSVDHYFSVMFSFCVMYIFLQAFSIPGSTFLSFISGALFGMWTGFFMVCFVATFGAGISYWISHLLGRSVLLYFFSNKMKFFETKINNHRHHIFNYLLFLRVTPFLPNWFINLASPVLGVPFLPFCAATYIGIMPMTFLTVRAGVKLNSLQPGSESKILLDAIPILLGIGLLSLLPTLKPVQSFITKFLIGEEEEELTTDHVITAVHPSISVTEMH